MKRIICMLLAMTMIFTLAACGTAKQAATIILPEEYDALYDKYIAPPKITGIIGTAWSKASELRPEYFVSYYAHDFLLSGGNFEVDEENAMYIPQDELETMVQSHFDVSAEYLRTGADYRAEKEAYEFYGIGSTGLISITEAEQNGKMLTIRYDCFDPADQLFAQGKLVIEVNGEDFKYLSNELERLD